MRECGSGRAGKATALQAVPDGFESHDPLAGVAQSVERELPKLEVAGSRPATRSMTVDGEAMDDQEYQRLLKESIASPLQGDAWF